MLKLDLRPPPASGLSPRAEWLVAFCLGFGLLLPWYSFLNAIPYFQRAFPAAPVSFYLTIAFNSPQLPAQLLLLASGKWPSPRVPLVAGYAFQAALLAAAPFLAPLALGALLAAAAGAGAATALVESALFGGCAELGAGAAAAAQAVLAGEGAASVLANAVQLLLLAAPARFERALLPAYFCLMAGVMAACAALSPVLARAVAAARAGGGEGGGDDDGPPVGERTPLVSTPSRARLNAVRAAAVAGAGDDAPRAARGGCAAVGDALALAADVARACWPTLGAIFGSMVLTFLVFPGVTADVAFRASDGGAGGLFARREGAWTLALICINSLGDLAGRALAGTAACGGCAWLGGDAEPGDDVDDGGAAPAGARARAGGRLAAPARGRGLRSRLMRRVAATAAYNAARAAALPVLVAAANGWSPPHADLVVALNMVLFSVTNGHAQTLAMMLGPLQVLPSARGTAAVLHVLCLIAGLWVGSAGALFLA